MTAMKQTWFAIFIILFSGSMFILFAPYFAIAETRYLSVAWDMKLYHSFIVPLLNGLPYAHKPPFFFWLINLDWLAFGVNEKTLRLIPIVFSIFNVILVYKMALVLWDDSKTARYASIVLSSTLVYLVWSALIMFDIIFTFWILLGMYGIFSAYIKKNTKSWLITGIAVGGGLLTKGPVVFVHILPVSILSFLWIPLKEVNLKWYKKIFFSSFTGIVILLVWVIPAVMTGGESYRQAILWGQTVNRVVSSFAHQRPIWWLLPWIPVLLLPWILLKPLWQGYFVKKNDRGSRFLLIWLFSVFIIHSLISCKQVHYLIPLLPAASLLIARNIAVNGKNWKIIKAHYLVGFFYIIIGVLIFVLPFAPLKNIPDIPVSKFMILSSCFMAMGGFMLFLKPKSVDSLMKIISISSAVFIIIVLMNGKILFARYDITRIANILKEKQDAGYQILHYRKYDGQFQFAGRLTKPILFSSSKKAIKEFAEKHEKVFLISYEPMTEDINLLDFDFQQLYRGKKLILWNRRGIFDFLKL